MIFGRVKPLDAILATAEKKGLHRSLGPIQLILFGVGCIIGTGIFVLTSVGAQKAGPALMISFIIAGAVCIVAALCYAEIASMVPVSGSAYTYSYATLGELVGWIIGWDLIIEYAVGNVAVAISWSGYFQELLRGVGIEWPLWLGTDYRTAVQASAQMAEAEGRTEDAIAGYCAAATGLHAEVRGVAVEQPALAAVPRDVRRVRPAGSRRRGASRGRRPALGRRTGCPSLAAPRPRCPAPRCPAP